MVNFLRPINIHPQQAAIFGITIHCRNYGIFKINDTKPSLDHCWITSNAIVQIF